MNNDDEFIRACHDWESGNLSSAFCKFEQLALLGDAGSQLNLGVMYESGEGTKTSREKAIFWYKKCWETNKLTSACLNIANLYLKEQNLKKAVHWLNKAIELDDDEARLELVKITLESKTSNDYDYDDIKMMLNKIIHSRFVCDDSREEAIALKKSIKDNNTQK